MRRFRVDASQKIQAAPVNFDDIDQYKQRNDHRAIIREIKNNYDELLNYAETKLRAVEAQVNSDIQSVISKYVNDLLLFRECITDDYVSEDEPSNVIDGISYYTDCDGPWNWLSITTDSLDMDMDSPDYQEIVESVEDTEGTAWSGFYMGDKEENDDFIPGFRAMPAKSCIALLMYLFTLPDIYNQVSVDSVVSVCEQIIFGYCSYVDDYCSTRIETAIKRYLDREAEEAEED
jgi:hypothetical protein